MVVSLSILSLLALFAGVSFLNLAPKYRLEKAVWELNSRLNYARYKAIFEGNSIRIKFGSKSYAIERYDESNKVWQLEENGWLEGVNIQANNSPTFHPEGTVSNLASIFIFNSWGKYRITLAITGRVKIVKL